MLYRLSVSIFFWHTGFRVEYEQSIRFLSNGQRLPLMVDDLPHTRHKPFFAFNASPKYLGTDSIIYIFLGRVILHIELLIMLTPIMDERAINTHCLAGCFYIPTLSEIFEKLLLSLFLVIFVNFLSFFAYTCAFFRS